MPRHRLRVPTALLFVSYGSGGPGTIGVTEFFPGRGGWRQALLGFGLLTVTTVLGLVIVFSERIDRHLLGGIEQGLQRRGIANAQRRAQWLYRISVASVAANLWLAATLLAGLPIALALAVAVILASALAGAGAGAGGLVLASALAGAGVLAGAVILAVAGAGILAVAGAGILAVAGNLAFVAGGLAGTVAAAGVSIWLTGVNPLTLAWMLILVILPVANALLDWPSWAVSRRLGHDVSDLMQDRPRVFGASLRRLFRGVWKPATFIVHVAADLLAAIVILAMLAVLLPFLVEAFNLVVASGRAPPLELGGYLQAAVRQPWPDGAWAISMLLTTLIPTALHAAAAIAMLLLLPLQAFGWRERLAAGLAADDGSERAWAVTRASWLVVLTPLVASALVVGLGYGLMQLIGAMWEPVAILLLEAAQFGIAMANDLALAFGWLPSSGDS